jgi:hypothetical protein
VNLPYGFLALCCLIKLNVPSKALSGTVVNEEPFQDSIFLPSLDSLKNPVPSTVYDSKLLNFFNKISLVYFNKPTSELTLSLSIPHIKSSGMLLVFSNCSL